MALLNPVYGIVVPFLCIFTVPLAIFAGITTAFAFSVLMFRVALVYLDIAIAFVPQYIMRRSSGHRVLPRNFRQTRGFITPTVPNSPAASDGLGNGQNDHQPSSHHSGMGHVGQSLRSPRHRDRNPAMAVASNIGSNVALGGGRRSRRPSQGSATSIGTITPINDGGESSLAGPSYLPTTGMDRDFEGIGGWRLDDRNDDDDWAKINSRLELPLDRTPRHHHRSTSGGPTTPGDGGGWLMMKNTRRNSSPERERSSGSGKPNISSNSSRVRTPQAVAAGLIPRDRDDGYFPLPPSPRFARKPAG